MGEEEKTQSHREVMGEGAAVSLAFLASVFFALLSLSFLRWFYALSLLFAVFFTAWLLIHLLIHMPMWLAAARVAEDELRVVMAQETARKRRARKGVY